MKTRHASNLSALGLALGLAHSLAGCGLPATEAQSDDEAAVGERAQGLTYSATPLYTWWSPSRGDNFTTSDPAWAGSPGATRSPDYVFVRQEGRVFSPTAPQPPDTVPLYSWYSPSRGDNFITSNPAWAGAPGATRSPDYYFVRMEGYAYSRPIANTVALNSFYSGGRGDNFATSRPASAHLSSLPPDYGAVRTEGYLQPPTDQMAQEDVDAFGFGNMKVRGRAAAGTRPLLLITARIPGSSIPFAHVDSFYDNLVFGAARPNVLAYFREVSNNAFTWGRAGLYPITYSAGGRTIEQNIDEAKRMVAAAGFNFAAYDADHDGSVTDDELGILIIDNGSAVLAATRWAGCTRASGVNVCSGASLAGEETSFTNIVHELSHLLGAIDLYGSNCLSQNVSLMGCTAYPNPDDRQSYHLDMWHKMQLGWLRPRIRSLRNPGGVMGFLPPQILPGTAVNDESPLLLVDPRRGMDEFFLVGFRDGTLSATHYDTNVADRGLDVWLVKQDANKIPLIIPGSGGYQDRAAFVLGAPSGGRGVSRFLKDTDGEMTLRWLDGTDSGARLRASNLAATPAALTAEWRTGGATLAARLDATSVDSVARGGALYLYGSFGAARLSRTASFEGLFGARADLVIEEWTPFRLQVRVPAGAPTGAGSLYVNADPSRVVRSNGNGFTIAP